MTGRSPKKSQPRSSMFTISLILGLLLIPLSGALVVWHDGSLYGTTGLEIAA